MWIVFYGNFRKLGTDVSRDFDRIIFQIERNRMEKRQVAQSLSAEAIRQLMRTTMEFATLIMHTIKKDENE